MGLIESAATLARPILNIPAVRRTRRNHGLEHATIHILAQRKSPLKMAGRSDSRGFFLYGNVSTEEVESAVAEALRRMRSGQHDLALHPNCGTNLLTTGTLATLAAMIGFAGTDENPESRLERFPTILLLVIGTLIFAPPLGMAFQRHFTTLGDPGDLEVERIEQRTIQSPLGGELTVHRVDTIRG
ncbi:MAG: hypothetical protein Kow0077_26080 [Anaerolineae bacterium]